ncbi:hypothetical protein BJP27_14895 [Pseudomonas oryzihabitans]|nr:hypothetical protein BJP27_14895 [Pseudomonas psychrotolerans]
MKKKEIEVFLEKLNQAIDLVVLKKNMIEGASKNLDILVSVLQGYKESAESGILFSPLKEKIVSRGVVLGLSKAVGDWSDDEELISCMEELDDSYEKIMSV